jgi:hypothetical protein
MKVAEKIEKKLNRLEDGATFNYRELGIEPSEYSAAAKAMERLIKKGVVNRASTGLFYKPRKTVFGELKPKEEALLRPYLFDGSKRIAYITGTALYNKLGLTTQIPKNYKVASRSKRVITKIGNIKVNAVKSYVEVTNDNYFLLEILDVLKDLKKIPDMDTGSALKNILKKIKELAIDDKERLIRIVFKYPPRVRALLGAMLSSLKLNKNLDVLRKSINPLTIYKYGIKIELLPTIKNWNIQ